MHNTKENKDSARHLESRWAYLALAVEEEEEEEEERKNKISGDKKHRPKHPSSKSVQFISTCFNKNILRPCRRLSQKDK